MKENDARNPDHNETSPYFDLSFVKVEAKTKKKKIEPSSIPHFIAKSRGKEEYICDIYASILNCRYRNDRIFSDWTQ